VELGERNEVIQESQEANLSTKREKCKGHYRVVTRDKKGRIVSVRKWVGRKQNEEQNLSGSS